MNHRFLISAAAAALLLGTGFANAQGTGMSREAPSGGSSTQQSAPSSEHGGSATQMNHDGAQPGMKSSEQKSPTAGSNQRADETIRSDKSKSMNSENETKGGKDMKAESRQGQNNMKAEGREDRTNMKAEGRPDQNNQKAEGREDRNGAMNAESKGGAADRTTVGQAGGGAKLSTEQRTKISTVIKNEHVTAVTNVNFSVAVGTRVPHDIAFHPLPTDVVTIYPEWRGYNNILVRDEIVVVDPRTFEIVAIINT